MRLNFLIDIVKNKRWLAMALAALLATGLLSVGLGAAPQPTKETAKTSFGSLGIKVEKTNSRISGAFGPAIKISVLSSMAEQKEIKATAEAVATAVAEKPADTPRPKPVGAEKPAAAPVPAAPIPVAPLPANAPRIEVSASGGFSAEVGQTRHDFAAGQSPAVAFSGGNYFLVNDGQTLAVSNSPIKLKPAPGSILNLPGYQDLNWNQTANLNAFRGNMEIVHSGLSNRLWAVNELPMEDYLRGIAEALNDSPEEHLKVMAIVSRSYAVHHLANGGRHKGEPFHLKNSRNGNGDDQVYRGWTAETRQPKIAKGVADTAGTVVTYQGQPVITPYSSRPDGRTRTPAEAGWSYNWPWVVSVPDPDTAGMTRYGHGVGLSGYGSRARAERGDTAAQILGYYFPGTALGQVNTAAQIVRVSIYGLAP
jgi:hypothetical protein